MLTYFPFTIEVNLDIILKNKKLKHLECIRHITADGSLELAIQDVHEMEQQIVKTFGELLAKKQRLQCPAYDVLPVEVANSPSIE